MKFSRADAGHALWTDRLDAVHTRFVGRGPGDRPAAAAAAGVPAELAWCRQTHSARVLAAAPGRCGEGDALFTGRHGLALSVVTADCVPVLLAGDGEIAAAHAGWRGIAGGVVTATLARLRTPAGRLTAWLGPAIGPCCYEVGDEVAAQVAAASDGAVIHSQGRPRPHLDLHAAVASQLRLAGVERLHRVPHCTHCSPEALWSYRRQGPGAGRNLAFIWLRA
jgi:YfiH family protein